VPALILALAAALPLVVTGNFGRNVLGLMAGYALAAIGLNLLVGISGQISLGHGAFMLIGGYTTAILSVKLDVPWLLGVIAAAIVTGLIGFLLGLPALRLHGHYLALATLSFGTAIPQLALKWEDVTGGAFGLKPPKFSDDAVGYWVILAFLAIGTWLAYNIVQSRPGRALLALRETEVAAQAMGVNVAIAKTGIFTLSAAYAGVAGALVTHLSGYISPLSISPLVNFQLLAAIVVGGLGSLPGSIIGGALVTWLPFAASRTPGLASVVEGAAIILIVLFLPQGLSSASRFFRRFLPPPQPRAAQLAPAQPSLNHAAAIPEGALLEVRGLSVDFGGVHALQEVDFTVNSGAIHGLIGPNGAGKTTALNCISRLIDPSKASSIGFAGRELLRRSSSAVAELGISRTFQNVELCRGLPALDNVMLGLYHVIRAPAATFALSLPVARRAEKEARTRALELLDLLECGDVASTRVSALSFGTQKRVELARALACQGQMLILDEPAAGLDSTEREALVDLIRRVRDAGVTILLVEHDMRLVMSLCDRVTVLDFGRVIADGAPDEVQRNPAVVAAYLGEEERTRSELVGA
jgi:ABC-type branched-subunit amino acid transport system ATPase component/ABC-type branched-subunit amino acid transport system permease subunit